MSPIQRRFLHSSLLAGAAIFCSTLPLSAQAAPVVGRIGAAPKGLTTSAIAKLATPATVTIVTLGPRGDTLGQGSGFIVRSSGVIVTNWHVMAGSSAAVVTLANGERFSRVQALDGDRAIDVALLKVPGYGLPTLTSVGETPTIGTKVVAIGSPRGLVQTVTEGIVSARRVVDGRELVQVSASISPGSSGGPILDDKGRVFAIATSQITEGQQLNFAVPVRYALGLIPEVSRSRTLAEVFGSSPGSVLANASSRETVPADVPPRNVGPTPPAVSGSDDPLVASFYSMSASPVLSPLATPRSALAGFYLFRQDIRWPDLGDRGLDTFRLSAPGALVLAADGSGYVVRWLIGKGDAEPMTWVQPFVDLVAAPDGRVVLKIDGTSFSGFQTDEGVVLTGQRRDRDGDVLESRLRMMAARNDLSNTNGLYVARARTQFRTPSRNGDYVEWTGDAAVVNANDSLYVDLTLGNTAGGVTGGFLKGKLEEDGAFTLRNKDHSVTLEGTTGPGILRATFTDRRREGMYFTGTLTATRR